jgi:hypothetical protein
MSKEKHLAVFKTLLKNNNSSLFVLARKSGASYAFLAQNYHYYIFHGLAIKKFIDGQLCLEYTQKAVNLNLIYDQIKILDEIEK